MYGEKINKSRLLFAGTYDAWCEICFIFGNFIVAWHADSKLAKYIYLIGKNNFPDRTPFNAKTTMECVLPPEVTVIRRTDILKYILTCNPKTKRDPVIEKYIQQIKSIYPVVQKVENMFKEFHSLLMGKEESKLDEYLKEYEKSKIQAFCTGIKRISFRSRMRYPFL